MSWDSYIDNLLGQTNDPSGVPQADKACIIGKDGAKWTTDAHPNALKITPTEAVAIGNAFKSGDFTSFQANGVWVEGVKYQFLRENEGLLLAKKKDHGALSLQASKTAVTIAHVGEGRQQGIVNKGVGNIADYLTNLGM